MDPEQKGEATTHERLLAAACELFGQKGHRDTTVAEICSRADANIAAVNYHFRSKEGLYVEAWRHSFDVSVRAYPPDGGVAADAPAEDRFRGRIWSLLRRMLDPACHEFRIVSHEVASPTGLLVEAMHEAILPLRQAMLDIVCELLGEAVDERTCHLCLMSVMSQCLHLIHRQWHRRLAQDGDHALPLAGPPDVDVEELADHIVRFSLAGFRGVVSQARAGGGRKGAAG